MVSPIIMKYYIDHIKKNLSDEMLQSIVDKHGQEYLECLIKRAARRKLNAGMAYNEEWEYKRSKKAS